jgi:hypothetical protein
MLLVLRIKSTTRDLWKFFQSNLSLPRYERLVAAHEDLKDVQIILPGGQQSIIPIKDFYNNQFLPIARKFINTESLEFSESFEDRTGPKLHSETLTDRLLDKLELNSTLKETVPHHISEKSKPQRLSTFTYTQYSPGNRDYLISNSPDPRSNRFMMSTAQ